MCKNHVLTAKDIPARVIDQMAEKTAVNPKNGCYEWTGTTTEKGYGFINMTFKGKSIKVKTHRIAMILAHGFIPKGSLVRHYVCANRLCCNPNHLRLGTAADNYADQIKDGSAKVFGKPHPKLIK